MTDKNTKMKCGWCEKHILPRRTGGANKRFCNAKCRNQYHTATRSMGNSLVQGGEVPLSTLWTFYTPCMERKGQPDE